MDLTLLLQQIKKASDFSLSPNWCLMQPDSLRDYIQSDYNFTEPTPPTNESQHPIPGASTLRDFSRVLPNNTRVRL